MIKDKYFHPGTASDPLQPDDDPLAQWAEKQGDDPLCPAHLPQWQARKKKKEDKIGK